MHWIWRSVPPNQAVLTGSLRISRHWLNFLYQYSSLATQRETKYFIKNYLKIWVVRLDPRPDFGSQPKQETTAADAICRLQQTAWLNSPEEPTINWCTVNTRKLATTYQQTILLQGCARRRRYSLELNDIRWDTTPPYARCFSSGEVFQDSRNVHHQIWTSGACYYGYCKLSSEEEQGRNILRIIHFEKVEGTQGYEKKQK